MRPKFWLRTNSSADPGHARSAIYTEVIDLTIKTTETNLNENTMAAVDLLAQYGWSETQQNAMAQLGRAGALPARVLHRNRNVYQLMTADGVLEGTLSGKYQYEHDLSEYPVVGDWVLMDVKGHLAVIHTLLPRKGKFSRKEAGVVTNEQVLAANVDVIFIVTGLDGNFNLSRIQRYRTVVMEGGAKPVILLNKVDLCDDLEDKLAALRAIVPEDPIHAVSSFTGEGLEALNEYLKPGVTIAFFGSSGVGKSSLTNALLRAEAMSTSAVSSANGKGRHTTTTAELLVMPTGGLLIDTPGIREIQIWCHEDAVEAGFEDIAELASLCRFENCQHKAEPGCAVKHALKVGTLSERHYNNYNNLKREAKFIEAKQKQKDRLTNKPEKKNRPRQKRFAPTMD